MITTLKSKIHRCVVTDANLDYQGSLTIDAEYMYRVGLIQYEKILVIDLDNNYRYETYVIEGKWGSKEIVANGAAAHEVKIGHKLIIMAWQMHSENKKMETDNTCGNGCR